MTTTITIPTYRPAATWSTLTTLTTLKTIILRFAAALGLDSEQRRLEVRFSECVKIHDAMIRRICLGYAHTSQDLEDLYQDVLVNIWRGLPSFRADSSMRTWVYRIALNTCVSTLRIRSKQPPQSTLDEVILVPDESLETKETLKELYECIATLGPIDKAIVMMWLDEYSYEEIADTIGLKRNNVATRLHRAKEKLRSIHNA